MAYEIKIKGLREPIRAEEHQGATSIKSSWKDYKEKRIEDAMVTLGKWTGCLSQIDYFNEINSTASSISTHEENWRKDTEEYNNKRKKFLLLSPDEKAKNLSFFQFIYWGFTQKKSEDIFINETPIEDYAKRIQKDFFIKNPNRMLPDPSIFKSIIKSTTCHENILGIIEKAVLFDKRMAR